MTNTPALIHAIVTETLAHFVGNSMGPDFMDHEEHEYSVARMDCCTHLLAVYTGRDCTSEFKEHVDAIVALLRGMDLDAFTTDPFYEYAEKHDADLEWRVQELIRAIES